MKVELVRWGIDDLAVLQRTNTPEMTRYIGGPETEADLARQHADYLALWETGEVRMFRIEVDGAAVGYAGWWEEMHDGTPVYEVGCAVDPRWQGRGIAGVALGEVVRLAAKTGDRPLIVGYAHVDNTASNALCERAGFSLVGTGAFPSAAGVPGMSVNVWMIDTTEGATRADGRQTERTSVR